MTDGRYAPCCLCKVFAHSDEMILYSSKKYTTTTVNKWVCLWCLELLNKYKGKRAAMVKLKAKIKAIKAAVA